MGRLAKVDPQDLNTYVLHICRLLDLGSCIHWCLRTNRTGFPFSVAAGQMLDVVKQDYAAGPVNF